MRDISDEEARRLLRDLTDPKQRCTRCAKPLGKHLRFCTWCSQENPQFDEAELVRQWGMTLAEARAHYCSGEHRVYQGEALQDPELFAEQPHCPLCGARFVGDMTK